MTSNNAKGNVGVRYRKIYEICVQLDRKVNPGPLTLKVKINATEDAQDRKIVFIASILVP